MAKYINFNGTDIEVDANGYLVHHEAWSKELALLLADEEGVALSAQHWEVINFVRQFYMEYETSPAIRVLVKQLALAFGPEKGNSRYLQRLFPKGPAKQASKLAGLPKPAKCL
ncbi:TusE/DsrC/DsvC family sulfur relay protein [Glaciecola sp. MH2013]|uniref:TusE/DsrC/DsvC family sulfur relay protein n=1 Tax=Glaciecola sp. MH2013 TaxID=2785524 RepID=UPI0018A09C8C|nr:TusE/DsrC/DsvC family sulfur relay protein [Glaciecola sp. MH2013]MBF7072848.1 TusE/DsrC/DsvC family sulfur relay protein [Glaciecola sp. MH2013]